MKKLVVIVVLIALIWIVKLSFDVMQVSDATTATQSKFASSRKKHCQFK